MLAVGLAIVIALSLSDGLALASINNGCKSQHFTLPVNTYNEPQITRTMDLNIGKYAAGHRGVDLNVHDGDAIIAPENGEITWKGVAFGVPTVTYTVGGVKNTFQPAVTELKKGATLQKGDVLGKVKLTHSSSSCAQSQDPDLGSCDEEEMSVTGEEPAEAHAYSLHWGISPADNEYLNPLAFVYRKRVVLY